MNLRLRAAALCLVIAGASLARAPAALAYDCPSCRASCNLLHFGRRLCLSGCKAICSAVHTAKEQVVDPISRSFKQLAAPVDTVGGRLVTFEKTGYATADALWHDIKDLRMPLIEQWSTTAPVADLEPKMREYGIAIKEQFNSTSMAQALSSAFELMLIPHLRRQMPHTSAGARISRNLIYWYSRYGLQLCNYDKKPDFGSWALQAASHLQTTGVFEEKYWPFVNWNPADSQRFRSCIEAATNGSPPPTGMANRHYFIDRFAYLTPVALPGKASVRRVSDVKGILARGYPVVVAFFTFPGMWAQGATIPAPNPAMGMPGAAHYVLLVGFDDSTRRFKLANSFGPSWGDHGFGHLPYAYLERYGIEGLLIRSVAVR